MGDSYDDGVYRTGELVFVRILNALENRASQGKARPAVLVRRDDGHWATMGLTTRRTYQDETPRIRIPDPAAVGLWGPGFLWGDRLTNVAVIDIAGHIGWVDSALAEAIIDLAKLGLEDAAALRRSAVEHRSGRCDLLNEIPENPEAIESVTGDAQESPDNAAILEPVEAGVAPGRSGRLWKTVALVGAPVIVTAVTAVVTLALTHRSAVLHNAGAYANGLIDGYGAYENAYVHGVIDGRYEAVQTAMTLAMAT